MRILFVTGLFPNRASPHRGVYILRQAVALSRLAEVRVMAPVPFFPPFLRSRKYSNLRAVPSSDVIESIAVTYPRYPIAPKFLRAHHGWALSAALIRPFSRAVQEFRPDFVLAFFAFPYGYASVQVGRLFRVPVVIGVLGSDINVIGKCKLRRVMLRKCLNESARVLSVSRSLKDETIAIGVNPEKIVVIPNGVDPARFRGEVRAEARRRLGISESGDVVLSVANLVHVKGVDVVLRAFAALGAMNASLVVVGDGEDRACLERMSRDLGLDARVRFVGARPPSEVPLWMRAADVVVLGSRSEGHPNVLLEAIANGRPVVATRVGGVEEIVSSADLGMVVEPENPAALADGLRAALDRSWDEDLICRAGRSRTWADVADEILTELRSLTVSPEPRASGTKGMSDCE